MTDQLRQELEERLKTAEESGDQAQINAARHAIDHHSLECQAHTADRIKRIEADVIEIGRDVKDMKSSYEKLTEKFAKAATVAYETKEELQSYKDQAKGAHTGMRGLMEVLKWIVAAGGGAGLIKLLGA